MKVTQEQVDKYVAETLQPLVDELVEYAKGKNIPAGDFYLACMSLTVSALEHTSGSQVERTRKELFGLTNGWVIDTLRERMEEATTSQEDNKP
jgi:hypothetical protein